MNITQTITAIHSMSRQELNTVAEAMQLRRTALARDSVRALSIGDLVCFNSRQGQKVQGTVVKLNRKTASVDAGPLGRWRVTASLLERA